MKKQALLKTLASVGVLLGTVVLVGCQSAEIPKAEALVAENRRANISAVPLDVADADRKYLPGSAWNGSRAGISRQRLLNVDPADRKFYGQGLLSNGTSSSSEMRVAQVHPADVKFLRQLAASEEQIHPADIKFLQTVGAATDRIHPADAKFYFAASPSDEIRQLYLSLHPADHKFLTPAVP